MTRDTRLALIAGLLLTSGFAAVGCGPTETGQDGGTDGGEACDIKSGECECVDDDDCEPSAFFYCNTTTSTCQPSCRNKDDCSAATRGEYALDYCGGNLGCQCDEGSCVAALCSADADCGSSSVCRDGACVAKPDAATAQKCQITPDFAIVKSGQTAQFWVSFWDASNKPVVLSEGITWAAEGTRASSVTGTGIAGTATGGAAGASENAVKVTAGGATCYAKLQVLDAVVPANQIRVTVVNELTGRPVTGGHILVSQASNGNEVDLQPMDASGTTLLSQPNGMDKKVSISAFHNDYGYVTIANYDSATGSRDVQLALRRNAVEVYGGYKGTFTGQPQTPNVHAGIASMSIPGAVTDLSPTQLLGFTVETDIEIGSIKQDDVPLPAGVYLGFSQEAPEKSTIWALGEAGVCTSGLSGVTDVEAAINTGKCGTRTAWALAGDVPLGDLPIDAVAGGVDNIDFGKVLSRILPIFRKFTSSVVRDVEFTVQSTKNMDGTEIDLPTMGKFTENVNHRFDGVPLGFSFAANVPELPKFKDKFADGLIILGGADVKGRGMVPLGIGAGVNTEVVDGKTDVQAGLPSPGLVLVRMAPTHSGIENQQYVLFAAALSLQSVNDASAGLGISGLFHRVEGNKLAFDPSGATPVALGGSFLNFPEGAKYNFVDQPQPGFAAGRQFRFVNGKDLTAASIVRVQFTDEAGHRWQVITDPATANAGFVVPNPPMAYADRTFALNQTTGERSPLLVQALKLQSGATGIGFKDLVEFNGTNLDRLGDFMVAFAAIDYGRPEISWETPGSDGATIAPASTIKLNVSNFSVGTDATKNDGVVKISFANGPAQCTDVTINQDSSMGKGELSAQLPSGCTGANIEMTAQLYNTAGTTPIAPAVVSKRTANIQ